VDSFCPVAKRPRYPLTDDCQFDIIQNLVLVEGTECTSIN